MSQAKGKLVSMHENWLKYEAIVVPADAGHEQREATRTAFYGGGIALMENLKTIGDMASEHKATLCMEMLDHELNSFKVGL
jgi:hypothetical protein